MCKYCDLGALDPESFDSFFEGAATNGYKSMVCKHCSRTFLTSFLTLENGSSPKVTHALEDIEEKNLVLIPH